MPRSVQEGGQHHLSPYGKRTMRLAPQHALVQSQRRRGPQRKLRSRGLTINSPGTELRGSTAQRSTSACLGPGRLGDAPIPSSEQAASSPQPRGCHGTTSRQTTAVQKQQSNTDRAAWGVGEYPRNEQAAVRKGVPGRLSGPGMQEATQRRARIRRLQEARGAAAAGA